MRKAPQLEYLGGLSLCLKSPIVISGGRTRRRNSTNAQIHNVRRPWRSIRGKTQTNRPGQELFQQKIQPLLANVSMSIIRSSLGVSKWYASKIRQGYQPHPRHWVRLADLVWAVVEPVCLVEQRRQSVDLFDRMKQRRSQSLGNRQREFGSGA